MTEQSLALCLAHVLFSIGLIGIVMNRKNIIVILMCLELLLLAINTLLITFAAMGKGADGHVFVFFVLTVAAAEAAIGLAILVAVFRRYHSIEIEQLNHLKG